MTDKDYPKWYAVLADAFDVSEDTIAILAESILRGRGEQARFNIPELGGQGIWKIGNEAIIGNGFDEALNEQATELCNAIQEALTSEANRMTLEFQGITDTHDMMPATIEPDDWWPDEFGEADTYGNIDTLRYAYFPDHNRLLVQTSQRLRIFDTTGFQVRSMSRGGGADFMSAMVKTDVGEFPLSKLRELL